jgi:predicted DNA-binding ribbon-helix-helix protein
VTTKSLVKHSVVIAGHRTSVSLEPEFWSALHRLAASNGLSVNAQIAVIDAKRGSNNLSSAIRLTILNGLEKQLNL